jgi:hypothetical protein
MRSALLIIESLAAGVVAVVALLIALLVALQLYSKHVLHLAANQAVGWDPVSIFGPHWKFAFFGIPGLVFLIGATAGFWFFRK